MSTIVITSATSGIGEATVDLLAKSGHSLVLTGRNQEKLTQKIVDEINPCVIFLNNTPGERVEGEWPYDWLRNWPVIAIHHNPTWPLFNADLDVFNSETTKKKYDNCIDRIKNWKVIPPCIDTSRFTKLIRGESASLTIGKISNDNPKKFPQDLKEIFQKIDKMYSNLSFQLIGGNQYYKDILKIWGGEVKIVFSLPRCNIPRPVNLRGENK